MNYELWIFSFIQFFVGACIGSFLGVIIDRLPKNEGFLAGRSHCDFCKKPLGALDLIPIFSFVVSSGKCRYCHKRLSIFYPVIEIVTGVLFVIIFALSQGVMT